MPFYLSTAHLYTYGTFQNLLGDMTTSLWKLIVSDSGGNIIIQTTSKITVTTSNKINVTTIVIGADYSLTF